MEPTLEDVLDWLHDQEAQPTVEGAARMALRYPEHERAVIEHAAAWFQMRAWEIVGNTRRTFGDGPHVVMVEG